jgi:hypothetical protein
VKPWTKWQDWGTLVLGGALVLAPLGLAAANAPQCTVGTTTWFSTPSSLDAWITGALLIVASLWALASPVTLVTVWVRLVLGVWLFFVPWILGFMATGATAWTSWIIGVLVTALALWRVLGMRTVQPKASLP